MAHNLATSKKGARMMYVGETPWHRLGHRLGSPATAAEALRAAQLDWRVEKVPLYVRSSNRYIPVPGKFATVPVGSWPKPRPIFGIVGSQYCPLQNRDAFSFFDPIVGEDAAVYHTAGALGEGERVWILAKLPNSIRVVGDDVTDKFLLLSNSHDGSSAVQIRFTPIRVVCQNTLSMALAAPGRTIRIAHFGNVTQKFMQARRLLGIIDKTYEDIAQTFTAMTTVQLDSDALTNYVASVFPLPPDPDDEAGRVRATRDRTMAAEYFTEGTGHDLPGVGGTLWAAYNGIVEYLDYGKSYASSDTRLNSLWFGSAHSVKVRAYRQALELLPRS